MKLLHLILSILLVQVAGALRFSFLDEEPDFDVREVARKVCWSRSGSRNQITKYTTFGKLVEYFESLPEQHEFSSCAKNHLKSLKALVHLTSSANDDICGEEKLNLIESFHRENLNENYLSRPIELPRVLRSFFYQYASRISNICATMSYTYFQQLQDDFETIEIPHVDRMLEQSFNTMTGEQNIYGYQDLYLVWSLLDRFSRKLRTKMSDYLVEGSKRMFIKIPETKNLKESQEICSQSVKPIYSQTILPALRLVDLGYYPSETHFLSLIQRNSFVNRLYKLTVLCETLLPLKILDSDSNDNQTYFVKPTDLEFSKLELEPNKATTRNIIDPISLGNQLNLPLGDPDSAFKRARAIHEDVKEREQSIKRIVKLMVKGMKKKSYSNVKLWETKQSIEPIVKEVAERMDSNKSPSRRRRSLNSFFRKAVGLFGDIFFTLLSYMFYVIDVILHILVLITGLVFGVFGTLRTFMALIHVRLLYWSGRFK